MTIKPIILAPREPLTDTTGTISRSWWRALNSLFQQSGTTATPLVTSPSAVLAAADLSSGGTISTPDLAATSLIGNPSAAPAQPVAVPVSAASFSFAAGTLDLLSLDAGTLSGNGGSVSAPPGQIEIGSNLTLANGTLDVSTTGDLTDQTYAYSIRDTRGEVGGVSSLASDALLLALLGGGAPVSNVSIAVAAESLFGNAGTVAASGASIAIGAGLTLASTGTLSVSAGAGGIFAPLVNGDRPGPTLIADPFGQCVMVQIR